jgi:hypothetical protein
MDENWEEMKLDESWVRSVWWMPRPIWKGDEYFERRVELELYVLLL